jgi:hypothetical protein
MTHPNAIELEAFACGEPARHVADHLDACDACQSYVARARDVAPSHPRAELAPALAAARKAERSRRVIFGTWVALPLAAAAAFLLWLGAREAPEARRRSGPPPQAVALLTPPPSGIDEPETTFKGGLQIAIVRERRGTQERSIGPMTVTAGDRLRIEVAIDRTQAILGAVLGDDGSYIELMDGVHDAGTYFSDKSVRVDARPLSGTILVGTPEAVRLARVTHRLDGLRTIRVEWEGSR